MWEEWIKGLEPHGIIKASRLVWCQDGQRVNSDGLKIPKSVSWYTQGTWELKSVVVLSNAQPFKGAFWYTSEYVKYLSIYLKGTRKVVWYTSGMWKNHMILGMQCRKKMTTAKLNTSEHVSNLSHLARNFNLS